MNCDEVTVARQGDIHPLPMARAMAGSALTTTHRPRTRGLHGAVDPRTLFLYVIVLNILLMGAGSTPLVLACLGVVVVSLVFTTRPTTWIGWLVFVLVWVFCCFALPALWHSAVSAFLVFIAFWMFRFAGVFGSAVAAIKVLDVTRVGSVLTQMRAPRVVQVPVMVVVRFFPMAVRELRAIVQAMTLRGLRPGARSTMRHPLRTGEYVVIPCLASAARIADALSAAAIIKGLGAQKSRSTLDPSRFRVGDAVVLMVLGALIAWRVTEVIA